jgi:hypothetical protein
MAEREGFEPSVEVSPYTRLAGEHLKPTRSSLRLVDGTWQSAISYQKSRKIKLKNKLNADS